MPPKTPTEAKGAIQEAGSYLSATGRLEQTTQTGPAAATGAGAEAGAAAAEHSTIRLAHNGPLDPLSSLFDLTEFQRQQLDNDAALQATLRQRNLAVVVISDPTAEATQRALRDILVRPQDLQGAVDQALARQSSGSGNFQGARPRLNPRALVFRPAGDLGHGRNLSQSSPPSRNVSQGSNVSPGSPGSPGSSHGRNVSQGSPHGRNISQGSQHGRGESQGGQ